MVTIIDLAHAKMQVPGISYELEQAIERTLAESKKSLLFLNRRGRWRAIICQDCSLRVTCENCGVGLSQHGNSGRGTLQCHHCGYIGPLPESCKNCWGHRMRGIGVAIEEVVSGLQKMFPTARVGRFDAESEKSLDIESLWQHDIIVATSLGTTLDHSDIALTAFVLIESDLAVARYDMEERVYLKARHSMREWRETILQTYRPEADIISLIAEGNYRDFVKYTLGERKKWNYPPFGEVALVWIYHRSSDRVNEVSARLKDKLNTLASVGTFVAFDRADTSKRGELYMRSILIKWHNIRNLLEQIRGELTRNSGIAVEWQ